MSLPVAEVAALIWSEGRLLLCEIAGQWTFPGDAINPGETMCAALTCAVADETGLAIWIKEQYGVREVLLPGSHRIVVLFWCSPTSDYPAQDLRPGPHVSALRFVAPRDMSGHKLSFLARRVLLEIEAIKETD